MSIIRYALSDSAVVFNNQVNEIRIRKVYGIMRKQFFPLKQKVKPSRIWFLPPSAIWMLERQWILMSICKNTVFLQPKRKEY